MNTAKKTILILKGEAGEDVERVRACFDWNRPHTAAAAAVRPTPNWKRKFSDTSINENVKKAQPENRINEESCV